VSHGGDDGLPEEHEEHVNHEAWVIPYADLLTLLMAMFIALFAMSSVDIDKFKELSIGFNEALGGGELSTGVFREQGGDGPFEGQGAGVSPHDGGAVGPGNQPESNSVLEKLLQQYEARELTQSTERQSLREVQRTIEQRVEGTGYVGDLNVRLEERALVVTVVTDQVLFDSGSANLRSDAVPLLQIVADALATVDNDIVVEGHTDAVPISTAQFASNWELSGGRSGAVVRFLAEAGIDPLRLSGQQFGEFRPIAPNDNDEGRAKNRRVEIVVQSKLIEQTLDDNELGARPVGPADALDDPVRENVDGGIRPIAPALNANS